jgi:membrane fusion protein, multidrug efflux system
LHVFVWLVVFLIFAAVFYFVLGRKQESKPRPVAPITVTPATAQQGNIGVFLEAIGTVTPVYTASIFSQVTGVVTAVNYQEGQLVKKGDPLVDIDSRLYEAMVMQAEGALQNAQNLLAQQKMDLERYQAAWARNAIAKQILDDQVKLVLQTEGTVKNDLGTLKYNQLQVEYCHITAPISGRVGLRLVDPGNLVNVGSSTTSNPFLVITQLQPITVIFTLPEDSLDDMQAQLLKNATFAVDVYDRAIQKKLASGKVLALDNQIDTTTGTVKVRAIFDNNDFALFPNQFVNARLLVRTLQDVTLIPSSAIQQNGQISFVYVIQNGVAHLRNIKPGVTDNGQTQVEGINPGDVVADSSFDKLQNNTKVSLVSSKPAATPANRHGKGS